MKRFFFVFTFTVILLIPCLSFAIPADVEKLSGSDYFPAVDKALNEAKKSIFLVMYYVEYRKEEARDKTQEEGKVVALLDDLVKAKERGVSVTVILDRTTLFFKSKNGAKKMEIDGKNMPAFYFLKRHGIDVKFDTLDVYTHGKCVVVDGETAILGSHNWTKNSLTRSNEYSVLIRDKELAGELIKDFSKIQIDYEASRKEAEEYVVLSKDVLVNVLSGFVSNSNDYCWDVYIYLVGYFEPNVQVAFDYKQVAEYFGLDKKMSEENYREMLGYQTLKELQDKYGLLEYTPVKGQNAKVMLKRADSVERIADSNSKETYFDIPKKFWVYGWDRKLSLSGQFCYFVNLIEGGQSYKPWSMSKENLIKKYKVGKERISEGMAELRHWNLVEIEYGSTDSGKNYSSRMPNRYKLKDLFRIEDFEKELQKLYDKYGKDKVEMAREYAIIIFCENNLADVEEIVRMIDEYGEDKIKWAFEKVAPWDEANPKRSMAYVKGILKNRGVHQNGFKIGGIFKSQGKMR